MIDSMEMTKDERRRRDARNRRRNVTVMKVSVIALATLCASLTAYLVIGG